MKTNFQEADDIKIRILQFIGNHLPVFMLHIATGNFLKFSIQAKDPGLIWNGSTTEKIIEVVNLCPTEALAWKWNDEAKNESVGSDQLKSY